MDMFSLKGIRSCMCECLWTFTSTLPDTALFLPTPAADLMDPEEAGEDCCHAGNITHFSWQWLTRVSLLQHHKLGCVARMQHWIGL